MHAYQADAARSVAQPVYGLRGGSRGQSEAELGVVLTGHHVLVGVSLDPRRDADKDVRRRLAGRAPCPQACQPVDLVEVVDNKPAHPGSQGLLQLGLGFVVAVHYQAVRWHRSSQGDGELASCGDVQAATFLVGQRRHRLAQERLRRVGDAGSKSLAGLAATCPKMLLVVDEDRRPHLFDEFEDIHTANGELAFVADAGCFGQQVHGQRA